tara:strand:+ start:643 stop:840 length:198 start_codon:yes stop_codon:yes gene_type:complete
MNETMIDPEFSVDVENILLKLSELAPGSDIDINGCIASAGYVFCEALNICIRMWETDCPVSTPPH